MLTKHPTEDIRYFAERCVCFYRRQDVRHQVICAFGGDFQLCQRCGYRTVVTATLHGGQRCFLGDFNLFLDPQQAGRSSFFNGELVNADNNQLVLLDRFLIGVGRVLNLFLLETA